MADIEQNAAQLLDGVTDIIRRFEDEAHKTGSKFNIFEITGSGRKGQLLIESIKAADYPVAQSVILLLVALFLVITLAVDMLYALLDPRIRHARTTHE